jgi:hypothetical protein
MKKIMIRQIAACVLLVSIPIAASAGGRGGGGGFRGSGGGFDFHNDAGHPQQTATHSSTGPAGTSRTTTATSGANGAARTNTASNGNYSRTSSGAASSNGNYAHSTSASNGYGSHSGSTTGNTNSGNYNRNTSGSNAYGSYSSSSSGNTHSGTYNRTSTGTNAYGQTYHGGTSASNGVVYHGATVTNPVYTGYPAWGWNSGVVWGPVPYYYGGGFWGPYALGAATAATFGIIYYNNQKIESYQVQPDTPGSKLLASYHLTQVPCGPPNLVVIFGPNDSAICAKPNDLVSAGNYSVNSDSLTIVSSKS